MDPFKHTQVIRALADADDAIRKAQNAVISLREEAKGDHHLAWLVSRAQHAMDLLYADEVTIVRSGDGGILGLIRDVQIGEVR